MTGIQKVLFIGIISFLLWSPKGSAQEPRAYLVQALGHCGECHTPRNFLGAPKSNRYLAGGKGPDGKKVPNFTPTRLKKWSDEEVKDYLTTGIMPDGGVANKTMGEVIQNATSKLTPVDLSALISYL